jgi:hypothetical protein
LVDERRQIMRETHDGGVLWWRAGSTSASPSNDCRFPPYKTRLL